LQIDEPADRPQQVVGGNMLLELSVAGKGESWKSGYGPNRRSKDGQSCPLRPGSSDVNLFCYRQGIVHFDAEISERAFDLGAAKQKLECPEIAGASVDQSSLGSSERMSSEKPRVQSNAPKTAVGRIISSIAIKRLGVFTQPRPKASSEIFQKRDAKL
jgi:hypothetical protein